jgi:hypothetical protein
LSSHLSLKVTNHSISIKCWGTECEGVASCSHSVVFHCMWVWVISMGCTRFLFASLLIDVGCFQLFVWIVKAVPLSDDTEVRIYVLSSRRLLSLTWSPCSCCAWWRYTVIMFLDIIHRPILYFR